MFSVVLLNWWKGSGPKNWWRRMVTHTARLCNTRKLELFLASFYSNLRTAKRPRSAWPAWLLASPRPLSLLDSNPHVRATDWLKKKKIPLSHIYNKNGLAKIDVLDLLASWLRNGLAWVGFDCDFLLFLFHLCCVVWDFLLYLFGWLGLVEFMVRVLLNNTTEPSTTKKHIKKTGLAQISTQQFLQIEKRR